MCNFWFKTYSCFKPVKKRMQKQKNSIFRLMMCLSVLRFIFRNGALFNLQFFYIQNYHFQSAGSFNPSEIVSSFCLNIVSMVVYTDWDHQNTPKTINALHKILYKFSNFKVSTHWKIVYNGPDHSRLCRFFIFGFKI